MNGIDISHWQDGLDMSRVKEGGHEFAILKITDGATYRDQSAVDFYVEAGKAGIPVGGYCYSHATTPEQAWAEAQYMLETINGFPFPLGLYLDIEEEAQLALPAETLYAIAAAWCKTIQDAGYVAGLYGSEGTLWAKINPNRVPSGVMVWVAHYGKQPDVPCDLWQSSDSGNVDGVTVDTDEARSERFKKLVERGFDMPKDEPSPEPDPEDKPDISGALELLAAYIRTPEFAQSFLKYIEGRKKNECT